MNTIIGAVVAFVVAGGLATATVVGLVSSQTGAGDTQSANANSPSVSYGSTP